MDLGLRGRGVLVTGGTSGIGRAAAEAVGHEGASVAVTYQGNQRAAAETARAIEEAGGSAMTVRLALEDAESIAAAVDEVVSRWGRLDVLVANAVQWPTVHAALAPMRSAGWGRIVLISSGVAEEGVPGPSPYGVAKSGLHGLARQLAWDVGRDGILVNVVAAGFTLTERNLDAFPDSMRERVSAQTPSRRLSSPAEVAALIAFLGSGANTNLTGEVIREGSSTGRSGHVIEV